MKSLLPLLALALCVWGEPSLGQGRRKAQSRRAEAEGLAARIVAGDGLQAAVSRLEFLGEQEHAARTLSLRANAVEVEARRNISQALALLGSGAGRRTMLGYLPDPDPAVRMYAARGLGRLRAGGPALAPMLSDPNPGVRREVAIALGALRQRKHGPRLLAAARREDAPEVRAAMLGAVGESGDARQIRPLSALMRESSSESARLAAAQALCRLGAPAGVAFAKALLASEDRYERRLVLRLLDGAPRKIAGPVLRGLLEDPDRVLAATAARLLYQSGDASLLQWLVVRSHHAPPGERLAYEDQLELLHLSDRRRAELLGKAGLP